MYHMTFLTFLFYQEDKHCITPHEKLPQRARKSIIQDEGAILRETRQKRTRETLSFSEDNCDVSEQQDGF